ncbi:MAG TPA: DUF4920 domain-containing protein [Polyangiaceae bacterium]|nr:DUF4920 domain-containing protein [Polyangiaceae bacterium]
MISPPPRRGLVPPALFLGLALAACSEASPPPKADPSAAAPLQADAAKAAERRNYGAPLGAQTERVTLTQLLNEPGRYADKTVRVEGKVSAVCQNKGCWLELADEAGAAHVKLRGHSFFVPKDARGKRAEVEARVFPSVEKGHCEQEAEEQTGRLAKVELEASGVELF